MRLFSLFFLVFLLSCAGANPSVGHTHDSVVTRINMHVDQSFTFAEQVALEVAVDAWKEDTGGLADIHLIYDFDPDSPESIKEHATDAVLLRRESGAPIVQEIDAEACGINVMFGCGVLGWVNIPGGVHNKIDREDNVPGRYQMNLVVDRLREPGRLEAVAMHEFGHMLGLGHVKDPYALMFPSSRKEKKACLTQPDLAEFCRVNQCGDVHFKPCNE